MKKYYKGWYGITATITTHTDGTAKLIVKASGKTTTNKTYNSENIAKRVLSRVSDGTAKQIEKYNKQKPGGAAKPRKGD